MPQKPPPPNPPPPRESGEVEFSDVDVSSFWRMMASVVVAVAILAASCEVGNELSGIRNELDRINYELSRGNR